MAVYVTHELSPKIDISSAAVYGDLTYINHRYIYADELKDDKPPKGFSDNIQRMAFDFMPKKDYLLIAGDNLQLVMAVAALSEAHEGFFVLRFEREANGYLPVKIGNVG